MQQYDDAMETGRMVIAPKEGELVDMGFAYRYNYVCVYWRKEGGQRCMKCGERGEEVGNRQDLFFSFFFFFFLFFSFLFFFFHVASRLVIRGLD